MNNTNRSPVEQRLQQDIAEVNALGRGGVHVDLSAGPKAVVKALRESAHATTDRPKTQENEHEGAGPRKGPRPLRMPGINMPGFA